jgi:hypothetical protein
MEPLDNRSRRNFLRASSMLGLGAACRQGMIGQAFANSQPIAFDKGQTGPNAIRPFHANIPEAELTELRRRIRAARWPEQELVGDASQGVQLNTMQKVAQYWADGYDWRNVEARLNALPQFINEIDGLDIHLHSRSLET